MMRSALALAIGVTLGGCALYDGLSGTEMTTPTVDAGEEVKLPTLPTCQTMSSNVLLSNDFVAGCKSEQVTSWTISYGPGWTHYAGRPTESDNDGCGVMGSFGCDDIAGLGGLADSNGCLEVWGQAASGSGTWNEVRQKVSSGAAIKGLKFSYLRRGLQLTYDWKFGVYYEIAGEVHPLEEFTTDIPTGKFEAPGIIAVAGDPKDITIVIRLERTGVANGHAWVALDHLQLDLCHD
jgi:hypothetical protein